MSEQKENNINNIDDKTPSGKQLRQNQNNNNTKSQQSNTEEGKTIITNSNAVVESMQKNTPTQLPPEEYNKGNIADNFKPSQRMVNSDGTEI